VVNTAYAEAKKQHNTLVPRRSSPLARREELDPFEAHCNVSKREFVDDELYRWRHEEQAPFSVNLLAWWQANHHNYPILNHLAFDLLAAPASTAADERLFSMAGNVVNEQRPRTSAELARAVQCLRSLLNNGQLVQTLLCCFPMVAFLWLPSYGYLMLPMVASCYLWLPQLPYATCYCMLAKTILFIYIVTLSLLLGRLSINPFIHSMSPFSTHIPPDST
jgi:hypothetical protein